MRELEVGKVYRHFKGNYYYVEGIVKDSETKEDMVLYRSLYPREDSNVWVRSLIMFLEEIDPSRPDNITGQTYRFELDKEIYKDYTK